MILIKCMGVSLVLPKGSLGFGNLDLYLSGLKTGVCNLKLIFSMRQFL